MQLYSTLNLTPIERLEKEWNSLPKKVSQMYERLKVRIRPFLCVRAFTVFRINLTPPAGVL